MLRVRNLLLALGGALLLAGCGKDDAAGGLPLAYAPADTPYAMGNRELIPDSIMDAWWKRSEPLMAGYAPLMEVMLADLPAGARAKHPLGFALFTEASKLRTRKDFAAIGMGGSVHGAIYGVGLTPVLRLELPEPEAFKALIARAETASGVKAQMGKHGRYEYYLIDAEKVELIIALGQGHLVVTLWPKGASDAHKSLVLADAPLAKNVLSEQRLQKLESTYGFKSYASGYVDLVRLANTLLQPSAATDKALLDVFGYEAPEMSDQCRSDVKQIVGKAPRLAIGATRFDANHMDSLSVLELDSAIASALVPVAAQIPAVASQAKWVGFGVGFNSQALISFLEARAQAVAADPYKCDKLADLEGELKRSVQQLRSAGGFLNMAKGFAMRLDALDMDMEAKRPTSIDLSVLVASDAPQALLGMAAMGLPQIAQLGLENDGQPKALPLDDVPPEVSDLGAAWAVMTDKALAVRFAPQDQGAGVKALIDAPLTAPGTVLTYSLSGEIYRLLGKSMRNDHNANLPAQAQEQLAKFMESYADLIVRMDNNVLLTPRGVEIQQLLTLK